jgi:1-acyl-sn-glycerol-3-phosphate acyltransferase
LYGFCKLIIRALLRLLWDVRVAGRENVPAEGALVVTANHRSRLDPPLIGAALPRAAAYAAKKELFSVPGLGWLLPRVNAIPVDRANLSVSTLRAIEKWLSGGGALVFFPEGTRSKDGRLGKAKIGVGMMLARQDVSVLPAYIEGTGSVLRDIFRWGRVRVTFGRPYMLPTEGSDAANRSRAHYRRIADVVMARIDELAGDAETEVRETDTPEGRAARQATAVDDRAAPPEVRILDEGMVPKHDR